ncbi:hypothetical protein [Nocardia sp. SC052]|uniref:hypothetical protein n=1 Tax=Nocardia sichangensis TaxID=3385975 RepID=UPI0039A26F32
MKRVLAISAALGCLGVAASAPGDRTAAYPPVLAAGIDLPAGFQPEGIAIGSRPVAYFGSRVDGSIYRADLVTGQGEILSQGPGTPALGLQVDHHGRLFVAGGTGGDARVVDTGTGAVSASYPPRHLAGHVRQRCRAHAHGRVVHRLAHARALPSARR